MGVVNVTPDSFSDGGGFLSTDAAVAHGRQLLEEGADMLDVGGESTRPGAAPVDEENEKQRVLPVIERLAAHGAAVSADTMKPTVMRAALRSGACILNSVVGFTGTNALDIAAQSDCGIAVMHMCGTPSTMQQAPQYNDVTTEVNAFLQAQTTTLRTAGVAANRICVDPGIGFGKTIEHNWQLLHTLPQIGGGYPVLLGVSRKSFLGALTGRKRPTDRDTASAVLAALLYQRGAHIVRTHNVTATLDALSVTTMLD